jgi:hypothetical protein
MQLTGACALACVFCIADAYDANVRGSWRAAPSRDSLSTSGSALGPTRTEAAKGATGYLQYVISSVPHHGIKDGGLRMELRHGLVFGLILCLVVIVYIIVVAAWESAYPETVPHHRYKLRFHGRSINEHDHEEWKGLADAGELDLHSCFALSLGNGKWGKQTFRFIPKMLCILILQLGVAYLFIIYMAGKDTGHFYSSQRSHGFRAVGAMLYAYSCWRMYDSMYDECREYLLAMITNPTVKSVSPYYVWPLVYGELMNVGIASVMMLTLYFIFCQCTKPQDLLINCIAINFVNDIDNNFVQTSEMDEAADNFREAVSEWASAEAVSQSGVAFIRRLLPYFIRGFHMLVPLVAAFLAIFFVVAADEQTCHSIQSTPLAPYASWPFCIDIQM